MSQNRTDDPFNSTSTGASGTGTGGTTSRGTGGAGTGATDAGTTRSTTGTTAAGSSAASGSMTTTAGSTTGTSPAKSGGSGVGAQAQAYSEKIADAASQAKDYVSDKMSVVGDKIKDLQNTDVKEVAENARQYARQNPGQALLISAAAGFLLGILLRGGRR